MSCAHVPNKPTTTSMRAKGIDKYANSQTIMCTQYTGNTLQKQQCVHNTQTKMKPQYSLREVENT